MGNNVISVHSAPLCFQRAMHMLVFEAPTQQAVVGSCCVIKISDLDECKHLKKKDSKMVHTRTP